MNKHHRPLFVLAAFSAAVASGCGAEGTGDLGNTVQEDRGRSSEHDGDARDFGHSQGDVHGGGWGSHANEHHGHNPRALDSRALLDSTNTADFEATTGALDSAIPPDGTISQLTLKIYDTSGHPVEIRQFNQLAQTSFAFALTGLQRGQPFLITAHVVDASGNQTLVEGGDWVKLRPHLIFAGIISPDINIGIISPDRPGIISPDFVWRNMPVTVFADVHETNGDTGAHTECLLSVDGSVIATQTNVAVDPNGTARCSFATTFAQTGTHTVTISLANTKPIDFNSTLGSVSRSLRVIGF